jgi:diguanylate cyclase (GGDEF)-like protein/PAS domain S-box-containing protein
MEAATRPASTLPTKGKPAALPLAQFNAVEARLVALEKEIDLLFELSSFGSHILNEAGTFLYVNEQELTWLGYTRQEVIGKMKFVDFLTTNSQATFNLFTFNFIQYGYIEGLELDLLGRDGTIRYISLSSGVRQNALDSRLTIRSALFDITAERQYVSELRQVKALVESSHDAIIGKTLTGVISSWNKGAEQIFGYTASETVGQAMQMLIPRDRYNEEHEIMLRIARNEEVAAFDTVRCHKDGRLIDVSVMISPVLDDSGQVIGASKIARDISDRKKAEALMRRHSMMLNSTQDGFWVVDKLGYMREVNRAYADMVGYSCAELLTMHISQLDAQDSLKNIESRIDLLVAQGNLNYETKHRHKDGHLLDIEVSAFFSRETEELFVLCRNISERKRNEEKLSIAATVFESNEGMIVADAGGLILSVNSAFTKITGYLPDEVIGKNPRILSSGRHGKDFYIAMWEKIMRLGHWEGEIWNKRKNGEVYPDLMSITVVKNKEGFIQNYVSTRTDITLSRNAADEIENLAFYDPLTRLPNRRLLLDRLKLALASSVRSGKYGAILFLDLDNFKTLNDTLGHDTGDLLLQAVAHRLEACVRKGDTVARQGGDEFIIMLENLSEHALDAAAQADAVGEKILTELNRSYQLASHEYFNTPSIGATLFIGHDTGIDEIFKQSDIAMYQAKKAGRNTLRFFDPEMQACISARVALENELRIAIGQHQFELYYQIQVDSSGVATGAEALIRWRHPERGFVSPAEFIPLAEETSLILPIGHWVLDTACAQLAVWQGNKLTRHLTLSVNVSAKQFHEAGFVEQVRQTIQRHAINPVRLKLEPTESILLEDIGDAVATMNALKEIGVQFALDDFGTGFSSLQYLKILPINQLKIDQSFVRDLVAGENDQAIVRTIILMAQSLHLEVIAEGVETEAQLQILLDNGCNHFQGYFFGKPMPIEQFERALRNS